MPNSSCSPGLFLLLAASFLGACDRPDPGVRGPVLRRGDAPRLDASSAERFQGPRAPASGMRTVASPVSPFSWDLPEGWEELAPTQFRLINLRAPGGVECTVSTVGGGIKSNFDRWCGQMGRAPLSAAEFAGLATRPLMGAEAVVLDITGSFAGMGGAGQVANARMIGIARDLPMGAGQALFIKVVGPADAVAAQEGAIDAFVDSLGLDGGGGAPSSAAPGSTPPSTGASTSAAGTLRWDAPAGWEAQPARTMRLVTYVPASAPEVQCWISEFGSDTGGLVANVNRWRGEVGLAPVDAAGAAALPTVPMLGSDAILVEAEGGGRLLLGVAAISSVRSVFVKMTGPTDAVRAERERFLAFCESLRRDG